MTTAQNEGALDSFFKLKENGTTVRTEIIAGLTTFVALAYIIFVNPAILADAGIPKEAAIAATIWSTALTTMLMGAYANFPVALAPGMGLNAFFTYTVCGAMGCSWQLALTAVFVEGIIFILLSFTNFREALVNDIPQNLKSAISVGIGLFIAIIGLKNSAAVTVSTEGGIALGNLSDAAVALSLIGVLIIAYMAHKGFKGAIFFGILITWVLGMIAQAIGWYHVDPAAGVFSVYPSFTMSGVKLDYLFSFDFVWIGQHLLEFAVIVFSFLYVDIFDTVGTLIGVATKADLLDEDGKPSIVEYYELTKEMAYQTNEDGSLAYRHGVILNYMFNMDDLDKNLQNNLIIHVVRKKIEHVNEAGEVVKPETENGFKFETLVLDMVHQMDNCLAYEVVREKEFAPIKNKTGVDSVDTARELLKLNGVEL